MSQLIGKLMNILFDYSRWTWSPYTREYGTKKEKIKLWLSCLFTRKELKGLSK